MPLITELTLIMDPAEQTLQTITMSRDPGPGGHWDVTVLGGTAVQCSFQEEGAIRPDCTVIYPLHRVWHLVTRHTPERTGSHGDPQIQESTTADAGTTEGKDGQRDGTDAKRDG